MLLETKLNCSKVFSSGLSVSRYPRYPSLGAARGGARSCGGGSGQAGASTRGFCAARAAPPRLLPAPTADQRAGLGGAGADRLLLASRRRGARATAPGPPAMIT